MKGQARLDPHFAQRQSFASPAYQEAAPGYSSSSSTSSSLSASPVIANESQPGQESLVNKTKNLLSIASKPPPPVIAKPTPRPLLLNSASPIVTSPQAQAHPGLKTPDSSEWAEVIKMKKQYMHRHSQSSASVSSLSPSEAMKGNRSDLDSDAGSRVVPLNRRSISPMAPSYRTHQPRNSSATSETFSPSGLARTRGFASSPVSAPLAGTRTSLSPSFQMMSQAPKSPKTSYLDEAQMAMSPEVTVRKLDERPPQPTKQFIADKPGGEAEETDESTSWRPHQVSRQTRVRSKKYRPANLQMRDTGHPAGRTSIEQKTPSPSNLTVDWPAAEDAAGDAATTPRAPNFDGVLDNAAPMRAVSPRSRRRGSSKEVVRQLSTDTEKGRARKLSTDVPETLPRKTSSSSTRSRKISTGEDRESRKNRRQSAAHEGDDEGYDDLLSAYESEENEPARLPF